MYLCFADELVDPTPVPKSIITVLAGIHLAIFKWIIYLLYFNAFIARKYFSNISEDYQAKIAECILVPVVTYR